VPINSRLIGEATIQNIFDAAKNIDETLP